VVATEKHQVKCLLAQPATQTELLGEFNSEDAGKGVSIMKSRILLESRSKECKPTRLGIRPGQRISSNQRSLAPGFYFETNDRSVPIGAQTHN